MRLRRIRLEHFRGAREREIRFGDGVTIVEGPNEVGKSSIAEALDLVFEYKDSSRAGPVQAVFPVHADESPYVEVELQTGSYELTVHKRFGKGRETRLAVTAPTRENLTGDEAHARLLEILDETLDVDLWKALRVYQGAAVEAPKLAGHASLQRALDRASGGEQGGGDGADLFQRVEEEVRRWFTDKKGQPREELTVPRKRVAELQGETQRLEDLLHSVEADAQTFAGMQERLQDLERQLPELEQALQSADRAQRELTEVDGAFQRSTKAADLAQQAFTAAEVRAEERAGRRREASEAAQHVEQLTEQRDRLALAAQAVSKELESATASHLSAAAAARGAEAAAQAARLARDWVDARDRAEDLQRRLTELEAARAEHTRQAEVLAGLHVGAEQLAAVEAAERARSVAEGLAAEQGAHLDWEALGEGELVIDGEAQAGQQGSRSIVEPTELEVPGQLRIRIRPGADAADRARALAAAAQDLRTSLTDAGVASVEEARSRAAEREEAEQRLQRLADRQAHLSQEGEVEDLRARSIQAQGRLDLLEQRRRENRQAGEAEPGDETPPEDEIAAQALVEHAERELAARTDEVEHARKALEAVRQRHERETREADAVDARVNEARGAVERSRVALESARTDAADDAVAAQVEAVRVRLLEAQAELELRRSAFEAANPTRIAGEFKSAHATLENARSRQGELTEQRAEVKGRLSREQEAGYFEQLEALRAELDSAERGLSETERRAHAARRLHAALSEKRQAAQRAYVGPLRTQIVALGRIVFDLDFDVELNEDLEVANRVHAGVTLPLNKLSTGAREQLSLLARIAAAMLVAEDGGVPLILDDTLGYTDPERMNRMAAMLASAAQDCQVIVMTSSPERFRGVSGAEHVRLEPGA